MRISDRDALRYWDRVRNTTLNLTAGEPIRSDGEIDKHRKYLETHPVEWIKFFFPKYAKYPFAPFHVKAINRITSNPEWYDVLSWSRELAKSTVAMFIVMYLTLTLRKRSLLITSSTKDNATRLLAPYRKELESNELIKAYYGDQVTLGSWTDSEFITQRGVAFRALGAGQPPRGSRNEEIRPDIIMPDDFDTDEECLNPDVLNKKWDWFEHALFPTRAISEPTLILWCGNIIAKDCCITRAGAKADHWDVVNVRDKNGKSTWPEKNSEESIDRILSKISVRAAQGEYFNNPISEGDVFKTITYGKVPPLGKFKFLVAYGDPAPGENKTKNSSTKAVWLVGRLESKLYVIKGFLDRALNAEFIDWYFRIDTYVAGRCTVYYYMENNSLQDPFFRQVFMPLVAEKRRLYGTSLSITPDQEKKTDKATRIEANLEPLNREGNLIFNIEERESDDMRRLEDQFKLFSLRLKFPADGPDTIEGAKRIIENKHHELSPSVIIKQKVFKNRNRHRL